MDEIFIERIVKRKVDIKGMLLRVLAVVLTSFVIMNNFILRNAWVDINYIIRIFNISCVGLH